jgi:hypothetical protein
MIIISIAVAVAVDAVMLAMKTKQSSLGAVDVFTITIK